MNKMSIELQTLTVTEIQRFCMHDGPGVRTTVFLKGCPLSCAWCHNPETQSSRHELLYYSKKCIGCRICETVCKNGVHSFDTGHTLDRSKCTACSSCAEKCPACAVEICGREYTVDEILDIVEKDRAFYGTDGGITLSGGEPFFQWRAAIELLKACKKKGLSTAIETCGYTDISRLAKAVPYTDLFLWDVKDTNDDRHKRYVGKSNKPILENLRAIDSMGAKTRLRCIVVNGINTEKEHYRSIARLALSLKNCEGVDWLPYHAYAGTKSVFIGRTDSGNREWVPSDNELHRANEILAEIIR